MTNRGGSGGSQHRWVRTMGLASQVGAVLVAGIFVGWFIGQWLDRHLGTSPWLMMLFTLLGIAAGFIQMFRLVQEISADEESDER